MRTVKYKGKTIHPYESFCWNTTQKFFRGELGGGIARCVKCDDSLATMVMEETKKMEMNETVTSNTLTGVQKDNLVVEPKIIQKFGDRGTDQYSIRDYAHTIPVNPMSDRQQMVLEPVYRIRKLTPKECFRLMGVDDEDIDKIQASGISNSSQYKLAGNSIVVDVLYHIFRKAFVEKENESQQLAFF